MVSSFLAAAGVPIWIDVRRGWHTKTMVTDGAVTLTGSMNWTRGPLPTPKTSTSSPRQISQQPTQPIGGNASQCPFDMNGAGTGAGPHREKCASARADE
jgi:hypothetical protein